jgi:hypothetical protein
MNTITFRKLLEKTWKGLRLLGIVFCFVVVSLLGTFAAYSSQPSAEAANIISGLRNLKAAVMIYQADHPDTVSSLPENENHVALISIYMDNPDKVLTGNYLFRVVNGAGWVGFNLGRKPSVEWFGYKFGGRTSKDTYEKLEGKAKSTGLLGSPTMSEPPASFDDGHLYKSSDEAVWMFYGEFKPKSEDVAPEANIQAQEVKP